MTEVMAEVKESSSQTGSTMRDKFLSIYSFSIIFALFGIYASAFYACFNASMSTLERRYSFSSSTGAYVLITDNIATVLTSLFVGHYGKTAHKPRWMAIASLITGASIALMGLPYFLFGATADHEMDDLTSLATSRSSGPSTNNNMTNTSENKAYQMCMEIGLDEKCDTGSVSKASIVTTLALFIFGGSNFLRGFGATLFFTYGAPYIDDNVSKARMPLIFALIFASRVVGFPIGNFVSSFALKFYENPFITPIGLTKNDPSWIGAWWFGFIVFGFLIMTLAIPLFLFPPEFKKQRNNLADNGKEQDNKNINGTEEDICNLETNGQSKNNILSLSDKLEKPENNNLAKTKETKTENSLLDLPGELYTILKNPIIFCQMVGDTFRGFGILGFFVFQTRYLENEFRQSASTASFISGTTGFMAKVFGVIFGGVFITCLRPGPKFLTSYIFLVEVTSVFALILASLFYGPHYMYPNTQIDPTTGQMNLLSQCNSNCHCENVKYQPVCDAAGSSVAFFSPCHAGCKASNIRGKDDSDRYFSDCSCIPSSMNILRRCPSDNNVYTYAYIISIGSMISGSSRAGNSVTFLRSITADQKALAVALKSFWHSLVVSIPYPIVYGKIFDWNCIIWKKECNKKGNCWLYDIESLRWTYHGISIALIALGSVFDLIMIFLSPRLGPLYDEEDLAKGTMFQRFRAFVYGKKKPTDRQNQQRTNSIEDGPSSTKRVEQYDLAERPEKKS